MTSLQWMLFMSGTIFFILATWYISLRAKRYHGVYRFFAFECILAMVVLNYPYWFIYPFEPKQIISWCLLLASALIAGFGFYQFYRTGKPRDRMEETTRLITSGLFKYIRHPLYLSLMIGGFGVMLKDPGPIQIILSAINTIALYMTARTEEKEMQDRFGAAYYNYQKSTWMFIPYFF